MNKKYTVLTIILAVFCGLFALATTSHVMMKSTGIERRFDAKSFAERFAAAYQAGDIEALLKMHAASVSVNDQTQTKDQLKQGYLQRGNNKSVVIKEIKIVGGLDSFKEIASGKFSGKITFQQISVVKGVTKTTNYDVSWVVTWDDFFVHDWQIVNSYSSPEWWPSVPARK